MESSPDPRSKYASVVVDSALPDSIKLLQSRLPFAVDSFDGATHRVEELVAKLVIANSSSIVLLLTDASSIVMFQFGIVNDVPMQGVSLSSTLARVLPAGAGFISSVLLF